MKVKTLVGVIIEGKSVKKGEVIELPDRVARYLIAIKKVEEVKSARGKRTN